MATKIGYVKATDQQQPKTGSRKVGQVIDQAVQRQAEYRPPGQNLAEMGILPSVEIGPTQYAGQVPRIQTTPERELMTTSGNYLPGVGKRAAGLGELALQGLTGSAAQAAAGLSGLATLAQQTAPGRFALNLASGGLMGLQGEYQKQQMEQQPELAAQRAAQQIEKTQEAFTYEPRGMGAKEAMGAMGYAAEKAAPVIVPAMQGFEAAKEFGGKIAGPTGAAIVGTLPAAISEIGVMKIARGAKNQILKKLMAEAAPEEVIDAATGAMKKEVKDAITQAGLKPTEMLPLIGSEVEKQAEQIGKTVVAGPFAKKGASEKLADMIKADPEIVKIAREFGVDADLPLGVATKDYSHQRVMQGLASIAGSKQAERMQTFSLKVADRAKDLIQQIGGTTEKTELSDLYRNTGKKLLEDMGEETKKLYNHVNSEIMRRAGASPGTSIAVPISAKNTMNYIENIIEELGDQADLDPLEKKLYKRLAEDSKPTYKRLDRFRQDVGAALEGKKSDPAFADKDRDQLKALYAMLSKDQEIAAGEYGLAEAFNAAKAMHATRMGVQDKFINTLGKEWTNAISQKAREAILQLGRKNPKKWDELLKNIPEEMGPDFRKQVIASSVYDAMIGGQAMKGNISPKSYSEFITSMMDDTAIKKRLINEIGSENFNRIARFGKLVTQLHRAQTKQEYTGKIMSVPGIIDEIESISERVYGKIPTISKSQRAMETIFQGKKTKKSELGDKLLDSPQFREMVFQRATDQMTEAQISRADRLLMGNPTFMQWLETLGPTELKTLAAVGASGYVAGKATEKAEEMTQDERPAP